MLRINSIVCLWACLVLFMTSCKKDNPLSTLRSDETKVFIGNLKAPTSRCLTDQQMANVYEQNESYRTRIKDGRALTMYQMEQNHSRSAADEEMLTIPIHFIIVHRPGEAIGSGANISDARVLSQLEVLNQDFLRKNSDASNTPPVFPTSNSLIQFCPARIDPSGNATNGISRYASNMNFDDNEIRIKQATTWDHTAYLNVWVAPNIDGLGYAYLPSTTELPGANEDGAVILTEAFGGPNTGAQAPFDLGRTLSHEVGHVLGLDHIWGEGCNIDDGITDTPDQAADNVGCPNHPSPSCSNQGDMFMNYMDYTDDHCLNAFSSGQTVYMRQILRTSRAELVRPGRTSCTTDPTDPNAPTCTDGIRNGLETGIDCGGPNCTLCGSSPSADAGITSIIEEIGDDQECGNAISLVVTLKNFAPTPLTKVTIIASGTIGVLISYDWTGSLPGNASEVVRLPSLSLTQGRHEVQVSTIAPNDGADQNSGNDVSEILLTSSGGSAQLNLRIQPDDYAAEITWRIKDEYGQVVGSGGGYIDFDLQLIEETICLENGCYRLILRDSYGDGICCDYGEGWYTLTNGAGQELVASDGYYGYRETTWFCIEQGSFSRQRIDRAPRTLRPPKLREVIKNPIHRPN